MQQLIYNGVDLAKLGVLHIMGTATAREPAEAPQRERITIRVRLHVFEQSYADNATLIESLRASLRTQQASLTWQEEGGKKYASRPVVAGDDEQTAGDENLPGTYHQIIAFTFWYYNHDVSSHCLKATWAGLDMGAVHAWDEDYTATHYDEMRSIRNEVIGTVTASGRYQGNTLTSVEARIAALQAAKSAMMSSLVATAEGRIQYGTFNQVARVKSFRAAINQPLNYIEWTLTAFFTRYPNESDYSRVEFSFNLREDKSEGIIYLGLEGKIHAPTEAKARTKLDSLKQGYVPVGYLQVTEETKANHAQSNSANGGDGDAFTELHFSLSYRDLTTQVTTFKSSAEQSTIQDLGVIEKWKEGFQNELFNEMRDDVKRASGRVQANGKWFEPDATPLAKRQENLDTKRAALMTELLRGSAGLLKRGDKFSQVIRVIDFEADVNRLRNCIEWSLTASWTRFPNETDYSVVELQVTTRENRTEGTVTIILAGRIGAPTEELALAKLARMRTILIPESYTQTSGSPVATRVQTESDAGGDVTATPSTGTFIEMAISEEWQQHSADILRWELKSADSDDTKSGFITTSYSGSVMARGATSENATSAALARAAELGAEKYAMMLRSDVTVTDRQFLTSGDVFITVEFHYEYLRKGARTYIEVTSELMEESFGHNVETVSGMIAAPNLVTALAVYNTDVRNIQSYAGALLMNEKKPTIAQQRIKDFGTLDDRFAFSFTVYRPKTSVTAQFSVEPSSNYVSLEKTTEVRGNIFAASEEQAKGFLSTLLSDLALGKKIADGANATYEDGPMIGGPGTSRVFKMLTFHATYLDQLTGVVNGIVQCEVSEEVEYSATRWVEKPLPDDVSIIQNCGITCGRRTITVNVRATTETAVQAYIRKQRSLFLAGTYAMPAKVTIGYEFLPLTDGIPKVGAGGSGIVNVKMYVGSASFSEMIPSLPFV